MAAPATSHVDPTFIESFGHSIKLLRQVWLAPKGQPFVVSGSGTLTWDMTAANLIEPGDSVLVVNTGPFGSFRYFWRLVCRMSWSLRSSSESSYRSIR